MFLRMVLHLVHQISRKLKKFQSQCIKRVINPHVKKIKTFYVYEDVRDGVSFISRKTIYFFQGTTRRTKKEGSNRDRWCLDKRHVPVYRKL